MRAQDVIAKKRDGQSLAEPEIRFFIEGMSRGEIPDYQVTAWLMAAYLNGLSSEETVALTRAMVESGVWVKFDDPGRPLVDKHSTGGVGDKISFVVGPLVACCGASVPMIAGRGLGFTGGTLDKLEAIEGFRVGLSIDEFRRQVETTGLAIGGQTEDMAPADRKLYALRDVTATVDSIPLITASILSKKIAEGAKSLVLDVKVGRGALMQDIGQARKLARSIIDVAKGFDLTVRAVLTDMNSPLGLAVGNACEISESIRILKGKGEPRLTGLCLDLAGHMLDLAGVAGDVTQGKRLAQTAIDDGRAWKKFQEIVLAQGGSLADWPQDQEPETKYQEAFSAPESGWIKSIDARAVGVAAMKLGAGRERAGDMIDHQVGILLDKQVGDRIKQNELWLTAYYNEQDRLAPLAEDIRRALVIVPDEVPLTDPILEIME